MRTSGMQLRHQMKHVQTEQTTYATKKTDNPPPSPRPQKKLLVPNPLLNTRTHEHTQNNLLAQVPQWTHENPNVRSQCPLFSLCDSYNRSREVCASQRPASKRSNKEQENGM